VGAGFHTDAVADMEIGDHPVPGKRLKVRRAWRNVPPMKRTLSAWFAGLLLAGLAITLGGCVSYERNLMPGRTLDGVKRFFVLSNQNDNHGLDHQIEAALQIRGNEASVGPLTMLPDDAQVVVSYEDRWEWDFGDHLIFLQITARDRRSPEPIVMVRFSAKIPKGKKTPEVVGQLIDQLLAGRKP
jgi:hypothetical protein